MEHEEWVSMEYEEWVSIKSPPLSEACSCLELGAYTYSQRGAGDSYDFESSALPLSFPVCFVLG